MLVKGLNRAVVASIGPTTSGTLRDFGIDVDMEPSHPKMGFFVKEAAEQSKGLFKQKAFVKIRPSLRSPGLSRRTLRFKILLS